MITLDKTAEFGGQAVGETLDGFLCYDFSTSRYYVVTASGEKRAASRHDMVTASWYSEVERESAMDSLS